MTTDEFIVLFISLEVLHLVRLTNVLCRLHGGKADQICLHTLLQVIALERLVLYSPHQKQ